MLPGDGTGPEVMAQGLRVLEAVTRAGIAEFEIETIPCGGQYFLADGARDWPEDAGARCAAADVILLGAVGWPAPNGRGSVTMPDGRMAGWSPVIGSEQRTLCRRRSSVPGRTPVSSIGRPDRYAPGW